MRVKVVVGLGNPGSRYRDSRHNVGFAVIDELSRRHGIAPTSFSSVSLLGRGTVSGERVILVKPITYMNLSGRAVVEVQRYFRVPPTDTLVVADDVNLPLARLRARAMGSAGGHNGLQSIIEALATENFPRLRIGVGRGNDRRDLSDHVLARFEADEVARMVATIERAADAAERFVSDGIEQVMNEFNRDLDRIEQAVDDSG